MNLRIDFKKGKISLNWEDTT